MSREHPRAASTDLRGAALQVVRRALVEVVPLVGHADPIASRLADIVSAESRQLRGNDDA